MLKLKRQHLLLTLSLLVIIPLGFLSKSYQGFAQTWINGFSGDILYEVFWCLVLFLFIPREQAVKQIPLGVFSITCILEFLQLWKPPFLQAIRATFWGKTLLGTTFVWLDFPHYLIGCILGWLGLAYIWRVSRKKS